jgi:hypothetical protein
MAHGHLEVFEWARANGCPEYGSDEHDDGEEDE